MQFSGKVVYFSQNGHTPCSETATACVCHSYDTDTISHPDELKPAVTLAALCCSYSARRAGGEEENRRRSRASREYQVPNNQPGYQNGAGQRSAEGVFALGLRSLHCTRERSVECTAAVPGAISGTRVSSSRGTRFQRVNIDT